MATIRQRVNVPAGGVVNNVLAGSPFEFTARPSAITVAAAKASGAGTVVADISFGSEILAQDANVPTEAGTGRGPIMPDDVIVRDVAPAGSRVVVALRETGGTSATDTEVLVSIDPIA